jgi:hypothetical protein
MMHDFVRHVSTTLYRIPTRLLFEELYMIKLIPHAIIIIIKIIIIIIIIILNKCLLSANKS